MAPEAYAYVMVASLAGGFLGVLVMWNRKRQQVAGISRLRNGFVALAGTAASVCALMAFTRAFGNHAPVYAATVMILITGWTAIVHSVWPLPMPQWVLQVTHVESALLRMPWTGVRLFGAVLRNTPLRHLGGPVFLSQVGRDPRRVLPGIHSAETIHLWALLLCCPWLLYWTSQGRWSAVACALAVHLPLNIFPVLHLRHVTGRLEQCLSRKRRSE